MEKNGCIAYIGEEIYEEKEGKIKKMKKKTQWRLFLQVTQSFMCFVQMLGGGGEKPNHRNLLSEKEG